MGSRLKEDQQRVKNLLENTVTLLCEKGLAFEGNLKVQGLLGITVDDNEVFVVHINKLMEKSMSCANPFMQPTTGKVERLSKMASPIVPLASIGTVTMAPVAQKRGRGRPRGSTSKKIRLSEATQGVADDLDNDSNQCIVIKPEPDLDDVDDDVESFSIFPDESPSLLPLLNNEHDLDISDTSNANISVYDKHHSALGQVEGMSRALPNSRSSSNASEDCISEEPYITGIVPNVAENAQNLTSSSPLPWRNRPSTSRSCKSVQPTVSSVSAKIAHSAISATGQTPSPVSKRSNGCKVVSDMLLNILNICGV